MVDWHLVIAMMGIHALMFLSPGPDSIIIVARAVAQGFQHAFAAILGVVAAGCVLVLAVAFGLDVINTLSPAVWMGVRALGAAYLIYVGLTMVRAALVSRSGADNDTPQELAPDTEPYIAAFLQGLLTNLGNPKMLVLLTSFLPQFVAPQGGDISIQILILGLFMYLNGLICFSLLAALSIAAKGVLVGEKASSLASIYGHGFAGATMLSLGAWMIYAPTQFLLSSNR